MRPPSVHRNDGARAREARLEESRVVVGQIQTDDAGKPFLKPFGRRLLPPVRLDPPLPDLSASGEETVVAVAIHRREPARGFFAGRVVEILGPLRDPATDSKRVIAQNELSVAFPKAALEEADAIPSAIEAREVSRRQDLRRLPFVTVDGADARDHDDAVALEENGTLWVAVADVGRYVKPDRPLDLEAAARGNSYYFPDRVLPMLPERLSNEICSLRPHEDRLVLAARLPCSVASAPDDCVFSEAIIRSRARLTYEGVDLALGGASEASVPRALLPMLRRMSALAQGMYRRRMKEGGVDFDLSETKVILNPRGEVSAMARRERTPSQQIVEEFMLAANRGAARALGGAGYPTLYRVHDRPPEPKLKEFFELLRSFGFTVKLDPAHAPPGEIDRLLHRFDNDPRRKVLAYFLLRTMSQACYSPANIGHYGLGFADYVHFTSPIRRYADLVIHRLLRDLLAGKQRPAAPFFPERFGSLDNLALHISERERVAQKAERQVERLKAVRFLGSRRGDSFDGRIVGMVPAGLFVELEEHAVEGFVHVSRLTGDYYTFREREMIFRGRRRGKTIRLGDPLRVRVESASLREERIDFSRAGRLACG